MKRLLEAKENTRRGAKRGLGLLLALLLLASVMTVPGYAWITATTELSSADSVTAYFYVPETIYLNPDGRTFRYYVGSDKNGNWSNATAEKETGTVYFSAPGATDAEVSWELLGGGGVNMIAKNPGQSAVPLDNADAANTTDGTWSGTIADGSLSSGALAQNEQRTIEWKAEFKYDHDGDPGTAAHDYVAYAYTVIYAPFYEEAGQFGEARYSLIGTDPEVAQMYSFISGLHGVAGGDRTRPYSKWFNGGDLKGKPAMEEYKSGYLGSDTDGAGDPKDSRSAAWFPVKQGGGITQHYGTTDSNSPVESNPDNASFGLITVDKSRYSNLGQVPNLFAGLTYFYGSTLHTNVIKYIGVDGSASLVLASDVTAQSPNKTNGSFAHGPFLFSNFPVEERVYTLQFWARQQNNQDIGIAVIPWVLHTKQYVKLSVHTVDKAALRSNFRQLTALALDTDDLAQKGYQDELREKTQKLGEVLGNPLASQARIDSVYEGTAALISEIREAMPEAEGLIPRAQGQVTVPEAVYLSPKDASVFTVMTFDRAGSENPNKVPTVMPDATEATNIARTGNAADSVVRFTLPAAWNTTAVRNTMKIKYSTVGKDGTTEDKNIVTDLKINGTALTYDTFATYPGGAQDTEFSLRFSGVANTGGDPATLYKEGGIRWTFQFTYNNVAYETYAATWVHPTPVTQAGVMERLEYQGGSRNGGLSNFYAFVTGIHSASGGSARSAFVAANGNELASPLRVEPNLTTNYGYGWGDSEWGGALLGNGYPTSGGWDNPGVTGAWGGRISTFRDNQANNPVHYEARFNTAFPPVDGGGGIWNNPSNGYYYRFSGNSDQDRWTAMQGDGGIPRAQIAVDSSRYSAYTQLPFFSAGAQLFDWYDPDDHPIEYEIDEFREVQTDATRAWKTDTNALVFVADTLTNPASHDASRALSLLLKEEGTNGAVSRSAAAGLKSPEQGSIASTVGLDSKLLCIDNSMQWEQNASNNRTNGDRRRVWYYVWLDTNVVNKGTLRTNVWTANQIFRPAEMFDEAKYAPYREDMWRGALELGRVMLPAGKTAVQWNNEMNALAGELALTAAPDGKTGYDGEPVANLGTIVGEPKTAWDHLYQWFTKIEDGQPVADKGQAPLAAFGTSIGYVQHVKKSNGHPFYAENYGVFSEVTEQQYNEIYKDMFTEYVPAAEDDPETPEDETAEAHSVPPPPWETGLLYAPGDNGGVGRLFYPEEYYIEENGEAEILHPLVTPTYGGYTGVPPDAPADATEPAKLAWGAQWAAFRAAYPQYPDGSYRVVETGGVRRLVALEEQPGNRAVYDQRTEWYASGSEVTLGEGSPAGFRFYDDDGKADLTRWGPYTGNAGKGAPEGNLLLPGNGFGTYGTDDEAAFNGESKLDIEIDPAAAADTPVSEAAQQTREAALVYPMIAGSVRYDLRYEPIRPGYRYTSEGKIFVEAASEEEEDYYGREYADGDHEYYTKYTVNCAYPTEDVPVGKTFAGWISSADGNIYNADSETDPEDKYPDSFVWLSTEDITFTPAFSEIKVDFTIEGNGGTFSILGGTGLEYAGFSIEVPGREGPWSGTLDQKMAIYTDAQPEGGVASLRT
ncbi:MAG: hypothetical protein LBQ33_07235, partial [Oscillospiraceae bacterium]|nr:hypothetical protein [Oscillospiraceae bacterium]